ncbi:MAG: hypothetical protein M1817_005294 [Caeruleum heppii]|nr:MAG: hypothetical protein M1817_005294 [Caeruleum heppii]
MFEPDGPPPKRRKTAEAVAGPSLIEEITSARHLQACLTLQQDSPPELKKGVQAFKSFLESINSEGLPDHDRSRRHAILRDYLASQTPRAETEQANPYLPDLLQAWGFASQSNNESLLSAIPAVLALLLRTISTLIEYRETGLGIGRTLLQPMQLKLLGRGLSADRSKEHVISPCLRLLTEAISFDGGALAKKIYASREFTHRSLARNIGLRNFSTETRSEEEKRKPSVRSNALRFLLASFRFQDAGNKADLIEHRDIISALFRDIRDDPADIISSILSNLKTHIVLDEHIALQAKARLFSEGTLSRIATLQSYAAAPSDASTPEIPSIDRQAQDFLLLVCTTPGLGVLQPCTGWYPPGSDRDDSVPEDDIEDATDLDLSRISLQPLVRHRDRVPIRNACLAGFAQNLRPYANTLQKDLLLAMFRASPELVADYFFKKHAFGFDPKLSTTWIGYAAFLFCTVQLPALSYCGRRDGYCRRPPPTSIVMESILPLPLSQKTLTRCLNQSSNLIRFFAVRLLIVAFEKLQLVLRQFESAVQEGFLLWAEAAQQLKAEFCRRCPAMKDVIALFRGTAIESVLQKEAVTRLLSFYYDVIPQVALEEKFDISLSLTTALQQAEEIHTETDDDGLRLVEMQHLLFIAQRSPNMRWWYRPEQLRFSPFSTLLRLYVNAPRGLPKGSVKQLLHVVSLQAQLFQTRTDVSPLEAILQSLEESASSGTTEALYDYVDNCAGRYVRKPVRYQDDLEALASKVHERQQSNISPCLSPLLMTLVEQWPFVAQSMTLQDEAKITVAAFLARLLGYCWFMGEDKRRITHLYDVLVKEAYIDGARRTIKRCFKQSKEHGLLTARPRAQSDSPEATAFGSGSKAVAHSSESGSEGEPVEDRNGSLAEDPTSLFRWVRKDVQDVVEDGDAGRLIKCLCADDVGVRKQALSGLAKLVAKLEGSQYSEREMVCLLLHEVIETARPTIEHKALPTFLAAFAAHAVFIQADPQHVLYGKLNRFLHEGPRWEVDKIPLVYKILLHPPDEDTAHFQEVGWLLDVLIDGLRTAEDLDVYRRRNVFERILSLYSSPHVPTELKGKIIRLLHRASGVDGGSTTLVTRFGMMGWLQGQVASTVTGKCRVGLERLASRLYEKCDRERIDAWSAGALKELASPVVAAL